MKDELLKELIDETRMEDIAERYQEIAKIVGVQKFVELSDYARGDEIYFPKVENVVSPEGTGESRKSLMVQTTRNWRTNTT